MSLLSRLVTLPKRQPLLFGLGFSCAKTGFADFLVQKYVEKREELDVRRNAAFALFGFAYLGGVQYCLYVPVFGRLFPNAAAFAAKPLAAKLADAAGQRAVAAQVILDQLLHHPFMYFPAFYATRELIEHGLSSQSLADAMAKYRANLRDDLVALWKIWVPVTILNFAFSPMWLRIPVVATTSLAWTCVLSAMRGASSVVDVSEQAMDAMMPIARPTRRAVLDPAKTHVVLTASGPHHVQLLHGLTTCVAAAHGNVVETRAVQLGGDFTLLMLIEVEPSLAGALKAAIAEHQRTLSGVHLVARTTAPMLGAGAPGGRAGASSPPSPSSSTSALSASQPPPPPPRTRRYQLAAVDRPGIMAAVMRLLAANGLEVVDLKCEQRDATLKGGRRQRMFFMEVGIVGDWPDTAAFAAGLKALQSEHGVSLQRKDADDTPF